MTSALHRGTAPDYVDVGPIRAISQASNQPSGLDWSRTRFHDFSGNPKSLKGYLWPNDVLINSTGTGTLGRVGYFTGSPDGRSCMADSHVTIVRAKADELDARFSYYWLNSKPFQEYVYSALVVGATNQIELNRDRFGDAPTPLPPLDEQRRIANFLDTEIARIDQLVSLRTRQTQLVEEERASLLNSAFERETHIPTRLKHLLATRPRYGVLVPQFVDGDGVRFIRVNDLLDLPGRADSLRKIPHALSTQYARTITRPGDVLLSVVGTLGRAAIVPPELEGANVARAVASLRPMPVVPAELIAAWLTTSDFIRQAVSATSSDTAQATLGMEDLANFRLSWPSSPSATRDLLHEVRGIQQHGTHLACAFQAQSRLLTERRQALITAAVTGQIDVSTASGRNAAEGVSA
ncbi:restriction endonuclease subunit S [Streptomyces sp. ME02-6987-2C]|uniref:restriction endonuclease subunit S n=1 Tax=unclassified Streptomyces TaxID=2593676 RepID=UPI0029A73E08|nr:MULTISPECIES: restriction endonuclease subunit S [unclassified Streptomyces]MDX3367574.1 restriction endonuclease subunit S [Streptomyces sp. ME02-6987-2C]MDX3426170.1 restriction endonuclease subunit S [Streptomyces sp. ME02-6985-2c]